MRPSARYQIEIRLHYPRAVIWGSTLYHYDTLISFGDSFQEVLDHAYVTTIDDQSNRGPRIMIIDMSIPEAARYAEQLKAEMAFIDKT